MRWGRVDCMGLRGGVGCAVRGRKAEAVAAVGQWMLFPRLEPSCDYALMTRYLFGVLLDLHYRNTHRELNTSRMAVSGSYHYHHRYDSRCLCAVASRSLALC
jgi:hypothetical protein